MQVTISMISRPWQTQVQTKQEPCKVLSVWFEPKKICDHIKAALHLPCLERKFKLVFVWEYTKTGKSILRPAFDQSNCKEASPVLILIKLPIKKCFIKIYLFLRQWSKTSKSWFLDDVEWCCMSNIQFVCQANKQKSLCYFFSINVS